MRDAIQHLKEAIKEIEDRVNSDQVVDDADEREAIAIMQKTHDTLLRLEEKLGSRLPKQQS